MGSGRRLGRARQRIGSAHQMQPSESARARGRPLVRPLPFSPPSSPLSHLPPWQPPTPASGLPTRTRPSISPSVRPFSPPRPDAPNPPPVRATADQATLDQREHYEGFNPSFTYPLFGEDEKIYGFRDLRIDVCDASISRSRLLLTRYAAQICFRLASPVSRRPIHRQAPRHIRS